MAEFPFRGSGVWAGPVGRRLCGRSVAGGSEVSPFLVGAPLSLYRGRTGDDVSGFTGTSLDCEGGVSRRTVGGVGGGGGPRGVAHVWVAKTNHELLFDVLPVVLDVILTRGTPVKTFQWLNDRPRLCVGGDASPGTHSLLWRLAPESLE